jgi:hypothetical protein
MTTTAETAAAGSGLTAEELRTQLSEALQQKTAISEIPSIRIILNTLK